MPTNTNAYNSRVTDEALEKRFRDTFRAQGGAELVDDLYAQGVIVPIVDFTAAATGDVLAESLQQAWDFSTDQREVANGTTSIISTTGFWRIQGVGYINPQGTVPNRTYLQISDGFTTKILWSFSEDGSTADNGISESYDFIVFVNTGQTVSIVSASSFSKMTASYRQVASVNGDLTLPSGFTSS